MHAYWHCILLHAWQPVLANISAMRGWWCQEGVAMDPNGQNIYTPKH